MLLLLTQGGGGSNASLFSALYLFTDPGLRAHFTRFGTVLILSDSERF